MGLKAEMDLIFTLLPYGYPRSKLDKTVKSRFKDWIPAFAGMTSAVST